MKTKKPKVSTHTVIEINQHDVFDWLEDNIDENTNIVLPKRQEAVEKLNEGVMQHIANEIALYLVECGAYDDALSHILESGFLEGVFDKK